MPVGGVLLIDKPAGMTSHDVVDRVRRKLSLRRVGHAGTLDPLATGLLIVLVGPATKLFPRFSGQNKIYEVKVRLGIRTSSGDLAGRVLETTAVPELAVDVVEAVLQSFRGNSDQIPPMVSAKKINGKKLYQLERKGVLVERKPQNITIHDIILNQWENPDLDFRVCCSKGTYVRVLGEDIGRKLGIPATLAGLRRTASGEMSLEQALSLDELEKLPLSEVRKRLTLSD